MVLRHSLGRRDLILLVLGAALMHIYSIAFFRDSSDIVINTHVDSPKGDTVLLTQTVTQTAPLPTVTPVELVSDLPQTSIVYHAPGWTLFRNLYMSNGTFHILSNNRSFPEIRLMTSTSLFALNNPENIKLREPSIYSMDYVTPAQARTRWGEQTPTGFRHRVRSVEGRTLLVNEPHQFLRHYYHLVAELFFGVQAFWHGAFSTPNSSLASSYSLFHPEPPPIDRVIFAYSDPDGWRDDPGFNKYFVRAAYPSLTVETSWDWDDRIYTTSKGDKAWHFPLVLLTDRSASFRGTICGTQNQRIAGEAWAFMKDQKLLMGEHVGGWWEPVRAAVLRYASVVPPSDKPVYQEILKDPEPRLPQPDKIVITYISRQGGRRCLTEESHQSLVKALRELEQRRGWEVNILQMQNLSKDEQLAYAGRTTIMLGVHGNGLTHLIWMPPTRVSAVFELFYPKGFAHDYHWTTHALGMRHFGVWNDSYFTLPNKPDVAYPDGFQDNYIPVHGESVAKWIEDRVDGKI